MSRIWMWPKENPTNVYNTLLSKSIEEKGVEVKHFRWRKCLNLKKGDIFYAHWIHGGYQANNKFFMKVKSILFQIYLYWLKAKGVKIVWTIHNLYPHSYKFGDLEKKIRSKTAVLSDYLFVASKSLQLKVVREFNIENMEKVIVIRHGNYINSTVVKDEDKQKIKDRYLLGYNKEAINFLFFGAIKKYKGINTLLDIFSEIKKMQATQLKDYKLFIIGKPDPEMENTLKRVSDDNIIIHFTFLSDLELNSIISSIDFVILPYEEITTSGSAILAASLNTPIITFENCLFREYFNDSIALYCKNKEDMLRTVHNILSGKIKKPLESHFHDFRNLTDREKIAKKILNTIKMSDYLEK